MKKELKDKIREDEFRSGLEHALGWMSARKDEVRTTAVVVAILALGAGVLYSYQSRRNQEAERAFTEALETFHTPVASELPEGFEQQSARVFPTSAEKYRKAVAGFDGVERRYGSSSAGRRARYYAALCRIELGETEEARKALGEIAGRRDSIDLEPVLARLALADLHRRTGELDKAVDAYRQILDDPAVPLPKDHALMSLALALEEAHRRGEARASYQRLVEEFPDSAYVPEARLRAEHLASAPKG